MYFPAVGTCCFTYLYVICATWRRWCTPVWLLNTWKKLKWPLTQLQTGDSCRRILQASTESPSQLSKELFHKGLLCLLAYYYTCTSLTHSALVLYVSQKASAEQTPQSLSSSEKVNHTLATGLFAFGFCGRLCSCSLIHLYVWFHNSWWFIL